MRKVLLWFAGIQLALVILQFYLATFGAFETPEPPPGADSAIAYHAINGVFVIPAFGLLVIIVALVAKAPGRLIGAAASPLVMALVQLFVIFPLAELLGATEDHTTPASLFAFGFHAIVGLVMLGGAFEAVRGARALVKAPPATKAAKTA
ncbi:DUF6220 domain-containing protein [Nonomuraea sp. NBC_01738]|uniref:DUF6220 domain-containing protein n=1 Tax=Nonomuraea sp. NBC_01738 TaxID=2976003 RepID=UPI002E128963|nr:DUF6220 domain-containing protein [Nonomuraea sp. NBC_01738]